jgi:flagellar basal body-associated protein FliL
MSDEPTSPHPEETPAPETPAAEPAHASWEVQQPATPSEPSTATSTEPSAETPYAPPPDYAAPPGYATPMAAPPARNMRPIITVVAIIVVVVLALVGYAGAGYAFANSKIDSARGTYNTVVSHQNTLTTQFNAAAGKLTAVGLKSSSIDDFKTNQAAYAQLVTQAQAAQPTITDDDASLAKAQDSLKENSWLTVFSKGSLDQVSTKIGHERSALASAKTITGDMIQLGKFFQAYDTLFIDIDTVGVKEEATDLTGAISAVATLKTDIGTATGLADAPGLPSEMKQILTDLQTLAADEKKLLDAAVSGDATGAQAAVKALTADLNKLEAYDTAKINSEIQAFYQPLIDAFNSEVNKANNT